MSSGFEGSPAGNAGAVARLILLAVRGERWCRELLPSMQRSRSCHSGNIVPNRRYFTADDASAQIDENTFGAWIDSRNLVSRIAPCTIRKDESGCGFSWGGRVKLGFAGS